MHIKMKHYHTISTLILCLVFAGGLGVVVRYYTLREVSNENSSYTSSQEPAASPSDHDILNGSGGYLDIFLRAPENAVLPDISLYCNKSGSCYFFLPSCALLQEYTIRYDETLYEMTIDNIPVHTGDKLSAYAADTEYALTIREAHEENPDTPPRTITFMQSENLPAVFLSTSTGSIDYINSSKEYKEPGEFICLNADGSIDSQGFLSSIKGHGNSSYYDVEKKGFQITFKTAANVLSMGYANKYILQANAFDGTYLRNKIVYEYCKDLQMPYIVDTEYVDLYFNGEYAGNYLLCEKVELLESRIDIQDGYLIEKILHDRIEEDDQVFQVTGMRDFLVKNPTPVSEAELEAVSEYMNTVEDYIKDCDSYEKYENLGQYIDIDSFVDMYLVNAITNDIDSNIASTYYYKMSDTEGGKLYAGPVWDYDNAWGRAERGYVADLNAYPTGYCEELFAIEYFRDTVIKKYNELAYPLMQEYLSDHIPALIERIAPSLTMDTVRWQDNGYHSPAYDDYDSSVSYLEYYIGLRIEHLYDRFNHPENYHYILFVNTAPGAVYRDTEYWIKDGMTIPDEVIEEIMEHFHCETFHFENGKAYDNLRPIYSDTIIYSN